MVDYKVSFHALRIDVSGLVNNAKIIPKITHAQVHKDV